MILNHLMQLPGLGWPADSARIEIRSQRQLAGLKPDLASNNNLRSPFHKRLKILTFLSVFLFDPALYQRQLDLEL
jgi:hypothetical protein